MSNDEFIYTQGLADGHWYWAPAGDALVPYLWHGPFMTKTAAIEASQGKKEVIYD